MNTSLQTARPAADRRAMLTWLGLSAEVVALSWLVPTWGG